MGGNSKTICIVILTTKFLFDVKIFICENLEKQISNEHKFINLST